MWPLTPVMEDRAVSLMPMCWVANGLRTVHRAKLTRNLKRGPVQTAVICKRLVFRFQVSMGECGPFAA